MSTSIPASTTPNATPDAATDTAAPVRPMMAPPSVHIRAVLTWLAIFPLVSIGMLALAPIWGDWHPVLRSLLLTAIVVPLAVYIVVPRLMKWHGALARRRSR